MNHRARHVWRLGKHRVAIRAAIVGLKSRVILRYGVRLSGEPKAVQEPELARAGRIIAARRSLRAKVESVRHHDHDDHDQELACGQMPILQQQYHKEVTN
jgi:hypothetical protein